MNGAGLGLLLACCTLAACAGPPEAGEGAAALPRPVAIREEGNLVQGASKEWEWELEQGYVGFTARLCLAGAAGSRWASSGTTVVLEGPNLRKSATQPALSADGSGCLVDYVADRQAAAGPWRLNITAGPSASTYHVEVQVAY